jgi:type VI secretion system protein ImpF
MARSDGQAQPQGLMPSLLDRLIDPDTAGTQWRFGYGVEQITDAVRRDLEELLNAHPPYSRLDPAWAELRKSVLQFGLPDLMSVEVSSQSQQDELARLVEDVILRFEPRLRNVRAVLIETGGLSERSVRFHVEARLNVDPAPEVAFETVLELSTGHASIKTRDG